MDFVRNHSATAMEEQGRPRLTVFLGRVWASALTDAFAETRVGNRVVNPSILRNLILGAVAGVFSAAIVASR